MSQPGMARHTDSSFNEANAVRFLSNVLESNHTIKTFFKENDRTPNYDGTLELIGKKGEPRKQFIVQIKKTKAICRSEKGKNKGRYVYDMETQFLYYVKEKVAESPAIFFVVDIENKMIFYLYLSDETLMAMNFEGKSSVRYAFGEDNIIYDIDRFTDELEKIAQKRNTKFLYKTKEEIAAMQDAVEYFNSLLDTDFRVIKEHLFPRLWRFGIGMTQSNQFTISHYSHEKKKEEIYRPEKTNMFGLYPQFKGSLDLNVSEFSADSMFKQFDCIGKQTPMDYVKNNLEKIIKSFCQNPPIELLPTEVLHELVFYKALQIHHYYESDNVLVTDKCITEVIILLRYIDYLIFGKPIHDVELNLKNKLLAKKRPINLFDSSLWAPVKDELKYYFKEHSCDDQYILHIDAVFSLLGVNCLRYYCNILELAKRNNESIKRIWDYNPISFMIERKYLEKDIKPICEEWFYNLPVLYKDLYYKVFNENNRYKYSKKIQYCIDDNTEEYSSLTIMGKAHVYMAEAGALDISYISPISSDFDKKDIELGLQKIVTGEMFAPSILNMEPTLYYDGIRCFLYQGICEAMGFKCEGITINNGSERLFI